MATCRRMAPLGGQGGGSGKLFKHTVVDMDNEVWEIFTTREEPYSATDSLTIQVKEDAGAFFAAKKSMPGATTSTAAGPIVRNNTRVQANVMTLNGSNDMELTVINFYNPIASDTVIAL